MYNISSTGYKQTNRINDNMTEIKKLDFEANPLDVNIIKLQLALLKRAEREIPENGDFAPVVEKYESKDPTLDLSDVKVTCKYLKDDSPKKDKRALEVSCINKAKTEERTKILTKGTKAEILKYLDDVEFLSGCKKLAKSYK